MRIEELKIRKDKKTLDKFFSAVKSGWYVIMSASLWFTLASTPAIMVFPDLKKEVFYSLWLNETLWAMDIARKLLMAQKPG